MTSMSPERVCTVGAILGEGPAWDMSEQRLWFVDIKGLKIHSFDPLTGALLSWAAPAQPGWVLPCDDGLLLAGLKTGLHRFDPADGSLSLHDALATEIAGNRLNDATIDGAGQLWFGSMDDAEVQPSGRYYRGALKPRPIDGLPNMIITNGPALSPDGTRLYTVDTMRGRIDVTAVQDDGSLGPSTPFATIEPGQGYPDGPTIDSAGCLWIGLFNGWGVRRYSPAGELMATINFPVANVTKIAFGGPDLRTAYATTAKKGLDDAALAAQPLAGDLFAFDVDIPGLPLAPIKMQ